MPWPSSRRLLWLLLLLGAHPNRSAHITLLLVADGSHECVLGHTRVAVELPVGVCVQTPLLGPQAFKIILDHPGACSRQGPAALTACNASGAPLARLTLDNRCQTVQWMHQQPLTFQARCHPHPRRILALHTPPPRSLASPPSHPERLPARSPRWIVYMVLVLLLAGLIGVATIGFRHRAFLLRNRLVRDCLQVVPLSSVTSS